MEIRRLRPSCTYALRAVSLGILLAGGPVGASLAGPLGAAWGASLEAQGRGSVPKPETPPQRLPTLRPQQLLSLAGPNLTLGEDVDEGPLLFANVSGVVEFADGTMVVAEASNLTLRLFDRDGRHLSTFGRRGRGPGEFASPVSLLKLDESRLLAMQFSLGATLLSRAGSGLRLERAATRDWDYVAGCATSHGVVVSYWDGTNALRRLAPDLSVRRAFARGFSRDSVPALIEMQNRAGGLLACSADGRVAFAQPSGPSIRMYGPDDSLRWETSLPSYRYTWYLMQRDRGSRGAATVVVYGEDVTSGLWFLDAQTLVVQVSRRDLASCGNRARSGGLCYPSVVSTTTYFVNATDGRLLGRSTAVPTLFSGGGPSMFRSVDDPIPQLQRYRVTPVSDRN